MPELPPASCTVLGRTALACLLAASWMQPALVLAAPPDSPPPSTQPLAAPGTAMGEQDTATDAPSEAPIDTPIDTLIDTPEDPWSVLVDDPRSADATPEDARALAVVEGDEMGPPDVNDAPAAPTSRPQTGEISALRDSARDPIDRSRSGIDAAPRQAFGCEGAACIRLHRLGIAAVSIGGASVVTGAVLWSRPPEPIPERPGVGYSTQPAGITAAVIGGTVLLAGAMMLIIAARASTRSSPRRPSRGQSAMSLLPASPRTLVPHSRAQ